MPNINIDIQKKKVGNDGILGVNILAIMNLIIVSQIKFLCNTFCLK